MAAPRFRSLTHLSVLSREGARRESNLAFGSLSLGEHEITASVADSGGVVGSDAITINVVPSFTLLASGYKDKGKNTVALFWTGATTANVDIYRNSALLITTANDSGHIDETGTKGGGFTFEYQVCEQGSLTFCSPTDTVTF